MLEPLMLPEGCISSFLDQALAFLGGCVGWCRRPWVGTWGEGPSGGRTMHEEMTGKRCGSLSEDVWSTSTWDMECNGLPPRRSGSSVSTTTSTIPANPRPGEGNACALSPCNFVNRGLTLWNETRQEWTGCTEPANPSAQAAAQSRSSWGSWNATYESLIGSGRAFPRPLPLSDVVELLVDMWEEEGMYD